jgi:FdhD protein
MNWWKRRLLTTSRCSYELVEKAVIARAPALVTISAPTGLAIARAQAARLTLVALARPDSALVFNDPFGVFG